ncbi:MAG TPA: hypothetical protein VEZ40_13790 [Pyrinomonadaceae bacterium]|nr:hypothetical protein [Pyrinomonadaceae bacterium]
MLTGKCRRGSGTRACEKDSRSLEFAWKLSRHQRAIIDIAGIYFQSVFLLALLVLYWFTGSSTLLYAFLFIDLVLAKTLNPFLRMDGYWLVADLFGIFNLREQSVYLLKFYFSKLFRSKRGSAAVAPPLNLSSKARLALTVYTILCTVFFAYLLIFMVRQSVYYLVPTYPKRVLALWQVAQQSPLELMKLFGMAFEILWRSVVLFGLSLFAYRLLRGLYRYGKVMAHSGLTRLLGKPGLQGGAAERL